MDANFPRALAALLQSEGGYSDDARDPGGVTNLGVTKNVWEEWVRHPVTARDMKRLTIKDVTPLYRRKYWNRVNADALPSGLDYAVFDAAVNSGPGRAVKWLQAVLDVPESGVVDAATLDAMSDWKLPQLITAYNATRLAFLYTLPTWGTFGNGWTNRIVRLTDTASKMTEL